MNAVTKLHPDEETVSHTWSEDTLTQVDDFATLTADIKKQRKALNDKVAAGKSELVAIGMNADAIAAAISYANTPEDDRANWDQTYIFTRKALNCPLQEDLFMAAMQDSVTVEAPAGKED